MKFFLSLFSLFLTLSLTAQLAEYNFNTCGDFSDNTGNFQDLTSTAEPACDCGLEEEGLYFDGNNDHLIFPAELDSFLQEDFTLDFYYRLENATAITDIFSIRATCNLDSFLTIKYQPIGNSLVVELAQDIGDLRTAVIPLTDTLCWNRVTLVKRGVTYTVFVNGFQEEVILAEQAVKFASTAQLAIANSPCLLVNEERFNGWLDNITIFNRPLSPTEIRGFSLRPDQIVSNDTTIVNGADVTIFTGTTCATSFTWTPSTALDDPASLDPVATPTETITYGIEFVNEGGCATSDFMTINVIDPDQIDCAQLFVPNAFTPNNDGVNDRFGISSLFLVDELEYFEIYDRWGAKMWSSTQKADTWDGSFSGKTVNAGMYLYKIKYLCGGEEFVKVDNFSVLR